MGIKILRYFFICIGCIATGAAHAQPFANEYRIALVLPFHSGGYHGSLGEAMLDYYTGFRMAAEDLEADGLKLQLYVFDSEKDSNALNTTLYHPDLKTMNLIVGPVYDKEMAPTEKFCNLNGSVLISPLKFYKPASEETKIINFYVPDSVRIASIACKAANFYPGYKFYLATDNSTKSKEYLAIMKRQLTKCKIKNSKTLIYTGAAIGANALAKDSVVVLSSISSTSAKDVLLTAVNAKKNGILFAHIDWHNASMSTFEKDEPKLIYPESNFTNPADSAAVRFRTAFMNRTYAEPSKYAYIGYDQAYYLCLSLMTFGKDFILHLPDADYRGFINTIHLQNSKCGVQNLGINYLQIVEDERREFKP